MSLPIRFVRYFVRLFWHANHGPFSTFFLIILRFIFCSFSSGSFGGAIRKDRNKSEKLLLWLMCQRYLKSLISNQINCVRQKEKKKKKRKILHQFKLRISIGNEVMNIPGRNKIITVLIELPIKGEDEKTKINRFKCIKLPITFSLSLYLSIFLSRLAMKGHSIHFLFRLSSGSGSGSGNAFHFVSCEICYMICLFERTFSSRILDKPSTDYSTTQQFNNSTTHIVVQFRIISTFTIHHSL